MFYRPCFCVSLLYIGVMVVIITDLASIFGCLVGLKEESTTGEIRHHKHRDFFVTY